MSRWDRKTASILVAVGSEVGSNVGSTVGMDVGCVEFILDELSAAACWHAPITTTKSTLTRTYPLVGCFAMAYLNNLLTFFILHVNFLFGAFGVGIIALALYVIFSSWGEHCISESTQKTKEYR